MAEDISQGFRLKNIDETGNYLIEKIKWNDMMSNKHKKVCTTLNYRFYNCWISAFASLVGILIWIRSSTIGLKICAITAGIKKYKSIIKKKKRKHDKIVFLAKPKLNSIEVLISKALID